MAHRKVKTVRTVTSTQIGPVGSSLTVGKNADDLTLRPDLGGVVAIVPLGDRTGEYLIPFGLIAHCELVMDVIDVGAYAAKPATTVAEPLVVGPVVATPVAAAPEPVKQPEPQKPVMQQQQGKFGPINRR